MPVLRESITETIHRLILSRIPQNIALHPTGWIDTPFQDMQLSQTDIDDVIQRIERCYDVEYQGDKFGLNSTPDDVIGSFYQLTNKTRSDLDSKFREKPKS